MVIAESNVRARRAAPAEIEWSDDPWFCENGGSEREQDEDDLVWQQFRSRREVSADPETCR